MFIESPPWIEVNKIEVARVQLLANHMGSFTVTAQGAQTKSTNIIRSNVDRSLGRSSHS